MLVIRKIVPENNFYKSNSQSRLVVIALLNLQKSQNLGLNILLIFFNQFELSGLNYRLNKGSFFLIQT
jgi:hypothetical protein